MRRWLLAPAALLAALAVARCGGRSSLLVGDPRGAGGATAASSGPGSGGAGGSAPLCNLWDQTATWRTTGFLGHAPVLPRIAPTRSDESEYAFTVLSHTSDGLHLFWDARLDPWSPPNGAMTELGDVIASSLDVPAYAIAASADEGLFGMFEFQSILETPQFFPRVGAGSNGVGDAQDLPATQQPGVPRAVFLARRPVDASAGGAGAEHLLGYQMRDADRRRLIVEISSPKWGAVEHAEAVACASTALSAAGVGVPGAFFIAAGSSRPLGQCDDPADAFDPPTRLQVTFYNLPLGVVLHPVAEWQESAPIERVELTMGDGALWVTYATVVNESLATLRVARVGLTGGVLAGPVDVATIARPAAFAAARLGERLAIASREVTGIGQTTVPVRVFSAKAEMEESFLIVPEAADEIAMAGEPGGKRLVVALTQSSGTDPAVWLGRYGCK